MEESSLTTSLRLRARRRYERSRLQQSLLDTVPALLLASAMLLVHFRLANVLLATGVVVGSVLCRWLGHPVQWGVGPGLFLAWIPLALPNIPAWLGSCCLAGSCSNWCSLACGASGTVVGLLLARTHVGQKHPPLSWAVSTSIVSAASAAGCRCVGTTTILVFLVSLAVAQAAGAMTCRRRVKTA